MDTRELLNEYQAQADDLLAQAEEHERLARDLRCRRDGLLSAIEQLRPLVNEVADDITDVVVDFDRCANNVERIQRIARAAPHKLLNTTRVTRYLLDHGESSASFKNLRTEINWALSHNPEFFEKVSSGTYRYRGDQPAVEEAAVAEEVAA